jgi:hypothetical protein
MRPATRSHTSSTAAIASVAVFTVAPNILVVTKALPASHPDLGARLGELESTITAHTLASAVLLVTGPVAAVLAALVAVIRPRVRQRPPAAARADHLLIPTAGAR